MAYKWSTPNAEMEIEAAGRVCWESWGRADGTGKTASEFIQRLKKVGHIDVMEEAELSVWIECSRSCSHQIVRHRTQHHLQASQRYIKLGEPEFMVPPSIAQSTSKGFYVAQMEDAWDAYSNLIAEGIRREDARFVLPNAALTKMKAKANFANWRKFFSLRSDSTSQWEIQMVSNAVLKIAYEQAPTVFGDQFSEYFDYLDTDSGVMVADIVDRSEFDNYNDWVLDPTGEE